VSVSVPPGEGARRVATNQQVQLHGEWRMGVSCAAVVDMRPTHVQRAEGIHDDADYVIRRHPVALAGRERSPVS